MVLEDQAGVTNIIGIYPLGTIKHCTKFNTNYALTQLPVSATPS